MLAGWILPACRETANDREPDTFYEDSKPIRLETGGEYILLLFSDGLFDNLSLTECVKAIEGRQTAKAILKALVDNKEEKYRRAQGVISGFKKRYEEIKDLEDERDRLEKKWTTLSNKSDRNSVKERERLEEKKNKIDERILEIDAWIGRHRHSGPSVGFEGNYFRPYLFVDGGHSDDTTVLVRVFRT